MEKTFCPGDVVRIEGEVFVVLENYGAIREAGDQTLFVLALEPQGYTRFGNSNNYAESDLRRETEAWAEKKLRRLNENGYLKTRVLDLATATGRKDYGSLEVKAAPLTFEESRRYGDVIRSRSVLELPFWLATAWDTEDYMGCNLAMFIEDKEWDTSYAGKNESDMDCDYAVEPAIVVSSQACTFVSPATTHIQLPAKTEKIVPDPAQALFHPGEIVKITGEEFLVLEDYGPVQPGSGEHTLFVLAVKGFGYESDSMNYGLSKARKVMEQWLDDKIRNSGWNPELIKTRGVDLTTLDGCRNYGAIEAKVAPLTLDELRRNIETISRRNDQGEMILHNGCRLATVWSNLGNPSGLVSLLLYPDGSVDFDTLSSNAGFSLPAMVVSSRLLDK